MTNFYNRIKANSAAIFKEIETISGELINPFRDKPSDIEDLKILSQINSEGYAVLPNYYNRDFCEKIREEMDQLLLKYEKKVWRDEVDSDNRIYGADRISDNISKFYHDEKINKILQAHEKKNYGVGFTLAGKLKFKNNNPGSGGGWHRDSSIFKQTKAIIYLSDVSEKQGPFQYLPKSHDRGKIYRSALKFNFDLTKRRFNEEEVRKMEEYSNENIQTLTGKAGTLILVDTRGIHRGKPIEEGERYALTNYNWISSKIPTHIQKLTVK